jgi:hypothetical protein
MKNKRSLNAELKQNSYLTFRLFCVLTSALTNHLLPATPGPAATEASTSEATEASTSTAAAT